jgi:hypothetical protein
MLAMDGPAYFATAVSYECKMDMKLTTGWPKADKNSARKVFDQTKQQSSQSVSTNHDQGPVL